MRFKDYFTDVYSEQNESSSFYLYHGGTMNHSDQKPSKGRWEYGPGLYLTNSYELASKYAKGSRKVFRCKIATGNEISNVYIPTNLVMDFIRLYGGSNRKQYIQDLERYERDGGYPADVLVNLSVNYNMRSSSAKALKDFLVENGVDYSIHRWSGGEEGSYILTLYDDSHLLEFKHVKGISTDEYMLPKPN